MDPSSAVFNIVYPPNPSPNLVTRTEGFIVQSERMISPLVYIVDLIARNRFTAWLINMVDPTFVGDDLLITHELTSMLHITRGLYNDVDFQDRLIEMTNNLINTYRTNQFNTNNEVIGKRDNDSSDDDDLFGPNNKKAANE